METEWNVETEEKWRLHPGQWGMHHPAMANYNHDLPDLSIYK